VEVATPSGPISLNRLPGKRARGGLQPLPAPAPAPAADASEPPLRGRFFIPAAEVAQLLAAGQTKQQLLRSLIRPASAQARPHISKYHVGCVFVCVWCRCAAVAAFVGFLRRRPAAYGGGRRRPRCTDAR
jgi:hypothetical protein